jgi:hypothetical protein
MQIAELHFDVNEISKELLHLSSPLLHMRTYPPPSSPSYWSKEISLVSSRKDSGLPAWLAYNDAPLIKLLLHDCTLQVSRVTAFVHDALARARGSGKGEERRVLSSCRVKNAKR